MRRFVFWAFFLVPALFFGCEFQSYEDYGTQPYDGELTFTRVNKKAEWKDRFDHATVAYDNKLWVFGGYNPGEIRGDTYYEDVWSSEDGVTWTEVSTDAPWQGRRGHTVTAFDDGSGEAMFLIGGYAVDEATGYRQYTNDVWKSTDGTNWTLIKERTYPPLDSLYDWFPRMDHVTVTAEHGGINYLYIIGGRTQLENHDGLYAQKYFNDVWRSVDGITWERLPNTDFGKRAGHAGAADPVTGTIYIQGGTHGIIVENDLDTGEPVENWSWLWSSPDGINWTASYDDVVPINRLHRAQHQMEFFDGKLWVFPGQTDSRMHYMFGETYHYATWTVENGLWAVDSDGSDIGGRHSYGTTQKDGSIWFIGGNTTKNGQNNDVWSAK